MRKLALALLLATAAAPAFAAVDEDRRPRSERRAERSDSDRPRAERRQAREERSNVRPERPERSESRDRPSVERSIASPPRARPSRDIGSDRPEQAVERPVRRPVMERIREQGSRPELRADTKSRRPVADEISVERPEVRLPSDGVDRRAIERRLGDSPTTIEERHVRLAPPVDGTGEGLVQQRRPLPRVLDPDRPGRRVSRTPVPGTEPPPPETATASVAEPRNRWRREWRRDRRYDWRDHRRRHRSRFHIGFYFDPFGWNYFRYGIGWRLWPSYYSSRFWLHDPWMYRLPPSYGPYRWIRYYDDALLVNIYTGHVVDVIHDFFW